MRYILDNNGYILEIGSHMMTCENKSCKEYEGDVPEGYETLEDWAMNANIRAYKVVSGQLIYDANKASSLEEQWEEETLTYSTEEKVVGTWVDGKTIYRKCFSFNLLPISLGTQIDNLIRADLKLLTSGAWRNIPFAYTEDGVMGKSEWTGGFQVTPEGQIDYFLGSGIDKITKGIAIFEYTKITD